MVAPLLKKNLNMKKVARLRRAKRTRRHIKKIIMPRLSVFRSSQHIYAQLFVADNSIIAAASSLEKSVRTKGKNKKQTAELVGQLIAQRSIKAGIKKIAFDRSGYKYHGRVQCLAAGARSVGLEF